MQHSPLVKKIKAFGTRHRLYLFWGSFSMFVLLFLVLWLSASLADSVFYFSSFSRWGLIFINLPVVGYLLWRLVIVPLKELNAYTKSQDISDTARQISRLDGDKKESLVNAYQMISGKRSTADKNVVKYVVKRYEEKWKERDFTEHLKWQNYLPSLFLFIPVLISASVLIGMQHKEIATATMRLLNPSSEYVDIPPFHFEVAPGSLDVVRGQSVPFEVRYAGPEAQSLELLMYNSDDSTSGERRLALEKRSDRYMTRLKDVRRTFHYRVVARPLGQPALDGKLASKMYTIRALAEPRLTQLDISIQPPAYSGLSQKRLQRNNGDINALAGSTVSLKAAVNAPLSQARLLFESGDTLELVRRGKSLSGTFSVSRDDVYRFVLVDTAGLSNKTPVEYAIYLQPDNPPFVEITNPAEDIEARPEDKLDVAIVAADDYGLRSVRLYYRYQKQYADADSSWQMLNTTTAHMRERESSLNVTLDFSQMVLAFGDALEYFAEAKDNNSFKGYQSSRTAIYRVQFPSLDEIFEEVARQEEKNSEELEDIAAESEELKKTLEEINRELKREGEMDWEQRKQLEDALQKQEKAQQKIEEIRREVEEMVQQLEANEMIDPQIIENFEQLQKLFSEIATPELKKALERLQKAMKDGVPPNELRQAMENFKMNQEAFSRNLERTLELFKQVQLEQQMDQLVQQLRNMREKQEKINEMLSDPGQNEAAENLQKSQQDAISALERQMQRTLKQEQLAKFPQSRESLEQAREQIEQENWQQQAEQTANNIMRGEQSQAADQSSRMQQQFSSMEQSMSQALQQMMQNHKQDVQQKMARTTQRMLQLSHEQEQVRRQTSEASSVNDDIRNAARRQAQVQQNLQKVIRDMLELSKETFFMKPEMSKNLAQAYTSMQKSLDHLSERQKGQAAGDQQQAMAALNRGAMLMQQAMAQMAGSQSGTGFEQFMQQLQQMAGQQGGINGETMGLFGEGQGGKFSMEQRAAAQRLARQQQALQQAMQEMAEQMGQRGDVLGRLDELAGDMEEVVQDLLKQDVSRKTIQRQQQILSRMLDAQKSVREREYSKKREARQATEYTSKDPRVLGETEIADQKALQDALRRALSEGYHSDYQELIKSYFESLSKQKKTPAN